VCVAIWSSAGKVGDQSGMTIFDLQF
jgi:hypothetical protein